MKPLFIALKSEYFRAFADGSKSVEYRRHGPRWNVRLVNPGRAVVLSHGYSGERLRGVVVEVRIVAAHAVPAVLALFKPDDELLAIRIRLRARAAPRPGCPSRRSTRTPHTAARP